MIADDDVRHEPAGLARIVAMLDDANIIPTVPHESGLSRRPILDQH